MAERPDLWGRIKDTRDPTTEEHRVEGAFPLGMVKVEETRWTVHGHGTADTDYTLEVSERTPRGRLAALFRSEPSITAKLLMQSEAAEGSGMTRAAYIAYMSAGGDVRFTGAMRATVVGPEADGVRQRDSVPARMSPQEAAVGFETSLADAHFAA